MHIVFINTKDGDGKMNDNFEIPPKANLSKLDEMVAFLIDNVTQKEAITIDDLLSAGFSNVEICEYASRAARIARRKFVRQIHGGGVGDGLEQPNGDSVKNQRSMPASAQPAGEVA